MSITIFISVANTRCKLVLQAIAQQLLRRLFCFLEIRSLCGILNNNDNLGEHHAILRSVLVVRFMGQCRFKARRVTSVPRAAVAIIFTRYSLGAPLKYYI